MPKRKKSTPVKLKNQNENWSLIPFHNDDSDLITEDSPSKLPKLYAFQGRCTVPRKNNKNKAFYFGKLLIGTTKNVFPEEWKKCQLDLTQSGMLKMNFDSENCAVVHLNHNNVIPGLYDLFMSKSKLLRFFFRNT